MGSKGGGTNTVQTVSSPPAQYLQAYQDVQNQAQQVAATPLQQYTGQVVAQFSPDQSAALGQIENLTANGGVQAPYLQAAQQQFTNATQPLLTPTLQGKLDQNSGQALVPATSAAVTGIQGAANTGTAGITGAAAGLTPESVQQWENPYTQDVVHATQAEFNNQNNQQLAQVRGNAISQGAFGGDREGVAEALTAQQQQLAQAPVIAGLESQGYTTGLQAAQQQAGLQTQAATSAGSLGLQGAQAAGQAGMTGATTESQLGLQGAQVGLGANEANAWLASQAGFGEANLGSEAQSTGLQGASALLQAGSLEQQMAQENLNIPYQQYLAQQAYPFQTTGWEANIAEGLGGASGGTSSTTSPAASTLSQVGGLGLGAAGLGMQAYNSGLFSGLGGLGGAAASYTPSALAAATPATIGAGTSALTSGLGGLMSDAAAVTPALAARGGGIPRRAPGGGLGAVSASFMPQGSNPNLMIAKDLKSPSGSTSTSTSSSGSGGVWGLARDVGLTSPSGNGGLIGLTPNQWPVAMPSLLSLAQNHVLATGGMVPRRADGGSADPTQVTVSVQNGDPTQNGISGNSSQPWYAPLVQENLSSQMAASLVPPTTADPTTTTGMRAGGEVEPKHFDVGGFASSMESPWWASSEERESVDRHGLLASPIAGRTDKLAVSPAAGSYVIPADVISGLGEGNTLAGANVMQRMLETGPHGIRMQPSRSVKGMPHPPPAYREGEGDNGMASGGMVARASGGSAEPTDDELQEWMESRGRGDADTDFHRTYGSHITNPDLLPLKPLGPTRHATGGNVPRYAAGGMSPASTAYLAGNGVGGYGLPAAGASAVPYTGINPSTGQGSSNTGNAALDAYLNNTQAGAYYAKPVAQQAAASAAPAASTPSATETVTDPSTTGLSQAFLNQYSPAFLAQNPFAFAGTNQAMATGGMVRRAPGGSTGGLEMNDEAMSDPGNMPYGDSDLPTRSERAAMGPTRMPISGDVPNFVADVAQPIIVPQSERPAGRTGMGPPPPPPPASTSQTDRPSSGQSMGASSNRDADFDKYLSRFQPKQPDPWLDLALAGFAMAAGKSPHALENIGAGAEKGIAAYLNQRQEASKEGLQSGETAARLADTAAYREGTMDWRNHGLDVKQAQNDAINQYRDRVNYYRGQNLDERAAHNAAMEDIASGRLSATTEHWNDQTEQGNRRLDQGDQRLQLGREGMDLRKQQIQNTEDYRQTQRELSESRLSQSQQQSVLTRAVTLSAATGMPLAKAKQQIMQEFPDAATPSVTPSARSATVPPAASGQSGFQFPP